MYQPHLPQRPQSAHETISSHLPVFLFSISSPRQKSQYLPVLTAVLAGVDAAAVIDIATAAARLLTTANQKQCQKISEKDFQALHWLCECLVREMCAKMVTSAQHGQPRTRRGRRRDEELTTITTTKTTCTRHRHRDKDALTIGCCSWRRPRRWKQQVQFIIGQWWFAVRVTEMVR